MSKNWNTSNQIPSENYLNQPNIFGWGDPLPMQTSLNRTFIARNKSDTKHTSVSVDGCYEKSFFCQHMQTRYTAYQFDINTYFEYESFDCIFFFAFNIERHIQTKSIFSYDRNFCNWMYTYVICCSITMQNVCSVKNPLCLWFLQIVSYFTFLRCEIDSVEILDVCISVSLWCFRCYCAHQARIWRQI